MIPRGFLTASKDLSIYFNDDSSGSLFIEPI